MRNKKMGKKINFMRYRIKYYYIRVVQFFLILITAFLVHNLVASLILLVDNTIPYDTVNIIAVAFAVVFFCCRMYISYNKR